MTMCYVGSRHDYATARNRRPKGRCECDKRGGGRRLTSRIQVLTFITAKVYTVINCEARLSCALTRPRMTKYGPLAVNIT